MRLIGILVTASLVISEAFRSPAFRTPEPREGKLATLALKAYQCEQRGAVWANRRLPSYEGIQKKILGSLHASCRPQNKRLG